MNICDLAETVLVQLLTTPVTTAKPGTILRGSFNSSDLTLPCVVVTVRQTENEWSVVVSGQPAIRAVAKIEVMDNFDSAGESAIVGAIREEMRSPTSSPAGLSAFTVFRIDNDNETDKIISEKSRTVTLEYNLILL